jgi:hypothetical protein
MDKGEANHHLFGKMIDSVVYRSFWHGIAEQGLQILVEAD